LHRLQTRSPYQWLVNDRLEVGVGWPRPGWGKRGPGGGGGTAGQSGFGGSGFRVLAQSWHSSASIWGLRGSRAFC